MANAESNSSRFYIDDEAAQKTADGHQQQLPAASALTLTINDQVVQIRSISISIAGFDSRTGKPANAATVEVNARTLDPQAVDPGMSEPGSVEGAPAAKRKTKKKSFLSKLMKRPSNLSTSSASAAAAAAVTAAATEAAAEADAEATVSKGEAEESPAAALELAAEDKESPGLDQRKQTAASTVAAAAAAAAAYNAAKRNDGGRKLSENLANNGIAAGSVGGGTGTEDGDSSDSEFDMSAHVAAAAAPVAAIRECDKASDGEAKQQQRQQKSQPEPATKPSSRKFIKLPLGRKKDKQRGSQDLLNFNFPQDLPDNVKSLFQITPELKLITTIIASSEGRTGVVKKQKSLLTEGSEKRFTVDGKSRSVWLDPAPGEAVEIWKEYFGDDGECNRALGRLPGTDKYGYILPDEVDQNPSREFASREDKAEYARRLQELAMFQNEYGNEAADDDDELYM